jgi:hypothetical protein
MFDKETGFFTPEYEAYTKEMSICYDLIDIAKEVLEKPSLRLVAGGPRDGILRAATDGTKVFLPKMHPNRLVATKHELAHIYFESDIAMRLAFVKALIRDLEKKSKTQLASVTRDKLIEDLCFLINIFDDVRVNSLWGLIYPGDGRDMTEWYEDKVGPEMLERAADEYPDGDIAHLFTYAILLCIKQDPKSTRWERFRGDIEEAIEKVHYKSFEAMLLIVRDLVEKLAKEIAEEDKQEKDDAQTSSPDGSDDSSSSDESPPDLAGALADVENSKRPGDDFDHDDAGFDHKKSPPQVKNPKKLQDQEDMIRRVLGVQLDDEDEVHKALDGAEDDQIQKVQAIQQKMADLQAKRMRDPDGELSRRVKADVRFTDVKRADIVPTDMTPEELAVAKNWRRHFMKVMGAMRRRVSPEGYELVTPLYIHQKLNNQPLVCYRRPQTGRGFRLKILVDLSGSMYGHKFQQVEKLYRVLQYALDFPFVHMDVMGFYSSEKGVVNIVRYEKGVKGLLSAKSKPGGITPLPHAIQVAGQDLIGCKHESYLFVLSDGHPVYRLKGSSGSGRRAFVHQKMLLNWTTDSVKELQRYRVKTYCFMIGRAHGYDIPSEEKLDRMFGRPYWERVGDETLFRDAFTFVKERFLQYLRTR